MKNQKNGRGIIVRPVVGMRAKACAFKKVKGNNLMSEEQIALVGQEVMIVEILSEKDSVGCELVLVENSEGIRVRWRKSSLRTIQ